LGFEYLPTAFFRSAKNRRTLLGPKAAPVLIPTMHLTGGIAHGLGPPEFRVRYVVRTNAGLFKFDDRTVKLKQDVLELLWRTGMHNDIRSADLG
jgi:hypothetical protein